MIIKETDAPSKLCCVAGAGLERHTKINNDDGSSTDARLRFCAGAQCVAWSPFLDDTMGYCAHATPLAVIAVAPHLKPAQRVVVPDLALNG